LKNISKNIVLISLLVLVNLAIFLFCKILTDEGNYIWAKTDPNRKLLISIATLDLMRIKYFIYANSINFFLLGIYFAYDYKKRLGLFIAVLGVVIFFGGNKLFEAEAVENYYIIFQNQNVPSDFMLEPVKSAGKGIGPYLIKDVNNKRSPLRKYAIAGLGEIKYTSSVEVINTILHDLKEDPQIRGEAYMALLKMNTEKSLSYTRIFMASSHPAVDQEVIEYVRPKLTKL
jgi:hypothetical protein